MKNRFDIRVLFVDDHKDFLRMRELCLSDFFRISTANNIADALTTVRSGGIDVVVTDKNMGGHRGILPLLDYMQNERPYVPVIINSGEDGSRARRELYCHAFIEKAGSDDPIAELKTKIIQLVDRINNSY